MNAVFRRETLSYFTSPIGYIFLAAFYAFSAFSFTNNSLRYGTTNMDGLFQQLMIILIVLIPILTMRTLSEEKKNKTDQCLLTAPISLGGIVAGKFLAAFLIYIMGVAITLVYAVVVSAFAAPDWAVVIGNIVGITLLGAAFIAVGIFCSSLTENQVVAAVMSFIALIAASFMSVIGGLIPAVQEGKWYTDIIGGIKTAFNKLSFSERYYDFTFGIFNFSNVVFFISAAAAFLFLTVRVLEKRRWS